MNILRRLFGQPEPVVVPEPDEPVLEADPYLITILDRPFDWDDEDDTANFAMELEELD